MCTRYRVAKKLSILRVLIRLLVGNDLVEVMVWGRWHLFEWEKGTQNTHRGDHTIVDSTQGMLEVTDPMTNGVDSEYKKLPSTVSGICSFSMLSK